MIAFLSKKDGGQQIMIRLNGGCNAKEVKYDRSVNQGV
jgi:hypothetical protein